MAAMALMGPDRSASARGTARRRAWTLPLGPLLRRGRWYAARLAAMSPGEIPHRIAEASRRAKWRQAAGGWQALRAAGDGPIADFALMRARLARAGAADGAHPAQDSLRRTLAGRLGLLGVAWPAFAVERGRLNIPKSFWFHDPVTGRAWPGAETPGFDIDVRATGEKIGDVKFVWEPNRLQFLHPLAAALAATGDPALRQMALAALDGWAAANPPYRGVNWVSGLELALRLLSIALVVTAADPATLRIEERALIRRLVLAHARFLAAFPSLFSSANNHRIAEGLGLFVAGALVPDLPEAPGWLAQGRRVLETEAVRQILADGVGAEQSPTDQAFSMEMLALAVRLADDLGAPLDPAVSDRLARGAEFLAWLTDQNGHAPAIGDDDEGRVIAQPPDREPRYVASIVAAVAGLTGRADLAPAARDPHLRDAMFDSPPAAPRARSGLRISELGGISIARETIAGRGVHLVFDHGPLGLLPLAAHGHADALALWLTVDGEPVFVDAGTYLYFSGGATRTGLRESLAHNTLAIDGASHSRASTAFGWAQAASAELVAAGRGPDWWVLGGHDGYRKRFGVRHLRQVRRTPTGYAIRDRLDGAGAPLPVTLRFLCPADVALTAASSGFAIGGRNGPLCRIAPPHGYAVETIETARSERFGQIAPATQLVFAGLLGREAVTTLIDIAARPAAGRAADAARAAATHAGALV
jgi:hypothetical protein